MTLTVNGQAAVPGCVVSSGWGQYGGVHLLEQADCFRLGPGDLSFDLKLNEIRHEWPKNNDGSLCGAYGSDRDIDQGKNTGPWAAILNYGDTDGQTAMELSGEVLDLLNENTEGGYWEWRDGECFLRSYVCPECDADARLRVSTYVNEDGEGWVDLPKPCDYCCDADDPGCFA